MIRRRVGFVMFQDEAKYNQALFFAWYNVLDIAIYAYFYASFTLFNFALKIDFTTFLGFLAGITRLACSFGTIRVIELTGNRLYGTTLIF